MEQNNTNEDSGQTKRNTRSIILILIAIVIVLAGGACGYWYFAKEMPYNIAIKNLENGDFSTARNTFTQLAPYKDSQNYIEKSYYEEASSSYDNGDYQTAIDILVQHSTTDEAKKLLEDAYCKKAEDLCNNKDFESAIDILENQVSSDTADKLLETVYYKQADDYFEKGQYIKAEEILKDNANTEDAKALLEKIQKNIRYEAAKDKLAEANNDLAIRATGLCTLSEDKTRLELYQGSEDPTITGIAMRLVFDKLNLPVSIMNDMLNVSTALFGGSGESTSGDYKVAWSYFDGVHLEISVLSIDEMK
ncbi:hypothetical protein [Butyrivibrio sp. WCD2001]|uniref:hypothetical protein n=1 Tax=Butyrivibrio sp. WCD2001 TaxID=1280681 RepID=UPI000427ABCF|nr:hypothetical protein [Butyrivibrio sp. WCD2001]